MRELSGVPILIIADNDISGKALATVLESLNMLPVWCSNSIQATEYVRNDFFPIIILESQQINQSILNMLRDVRRDERYCHLRFLVLTSQDNIAAIPEYLHNGIDDYLLKPVMKDTLASRLYVLLREQQRLLSLKFFEKNFSMDMRGLTEKISKSSEQLQQDYFSSLADNITAGVILLDSKFRVVKYNKLIKTWFSSIDTGICYRDLSSVFQSKFREASGSVYKCLQSGRDQSCISEVYIGDVKKVFEILVLPIKNQSNVTTNMLLIFNDITVKKDAASTQISDSKQRAVAECRGFCGLFGKSKVMLELYKKVELLSQSRDIVLLQGETGTGKELCANALHRLSPWSDEPLLTVNCGSLPESILESELFGHTRGAFTGAAGNKAGLFVAAGKGTIFLDEIETATAHTQVALLRVLDQMEVMPIGGRVAAKVYARVIIASNRDLGKMVAESQFRDDLYYRICGRTINLPSLREHIEDLDELADYFFTRDSRNRVKRYFSRRSLEILKKYSWPGNVREFRNLINSLVYSSTKPQIHPADLPEQYLSFESAAIPTLAAHEKELLEAALCHTSWNKSDTAKLLDISRNTVYSLIKKHGLDK